VAPATPTAGLGVVEPPPWSRGWSGHPQKPKKKKKKRKRKWVLAFWGWPNHPQGPGGGFGHPKRPVWTGSEGGVIELVSIPLPSLFFPRLCSSLASSFFYFSFFFGFSLLLLAFLHYQQLSGACFAPDPFPILLPCSLAISAAISRPPLVFVWVYVGA
jgi:hypothetical protein